MINIEYIFQSQTFITLPSYRERMTIFRQKPLYILFKRCQLIKGGDRGEMLHGAKCYTRIFGPNDIRY